VRGTRVGVRWDQEVLPNRELRSIADPSCLTDSRLTIPASSLPRVNVTMVTSVSALVTLATIASSFHQAGSHLSSFDLAVDREVLVGFRMGLEEVEPEGELMSG